MAAMEDREQMDRLARAALLTVTAGRLAALALSVGQPARVGGASDPAPLALLASPAAAPKWGLPLNQARQR